MSVKPTTKAKDTAPLLWLGLHFPALPLDVFTPEIKYQTEVPLAKIQPIVVLEDNRVSLANEAAQAEGIVLGCSLATAHSICPKVIYFTRDLTRELTQLELLGQCLYRFSSMVSLEPPDCILIEIQGSLKLWQSQQRLVKQAVQLCQQLGHECSTRLANTPQAAIALARSSATRVQDVPLHRIGLNHHGIKERILEQLANMGIYRLGQLMKLPKASLSKRFGQNLISYLKRLEGTLVEPRHCIQPSNHFTQQLHLLKPIMNKTVLLQGPMPYLTQQLQSWLIARQISCVSLEWQFSPFRGAGRNVAVTFAGGKQRQDDFMRLSHLQLDNIKLPEEVLSIGLEVKVVAPLQAINNDLFGSTESAAGLVSGLVDELTARLGPNTCKTIRPIEQYTPEKAWQRYSSQPRIMSANNQSKAKNTVKATSGLTAYPQLMGKRPLWLFPHPREIAITDLELIQGPERIQSNFQLEAQQKTISRDYYIAKHKQGAICWAFTESPDNKIKAHKSCWYLHGYFA